MNDHPRSVHPAGLASPPAALALETLRAIVPDLQAGAAAADEAAAIDATTWALIRRSGVLAAPLPVERGGAGLTAPAEVDTLFATLRLMGSADLSHARLYEGHVNAIALVERYGDEAQASRLADAVRDGALAAVWGADGARPLQLEHEGGRVRLRGGKVFASGAGTVTRPLVTATTPEGPIMLLLALEPGTRADLSGWSAQGMRSSASGAIDLDGLVVGREAIIGAPGDMLRQPVFSGGAWRFCAAHLGGIDRLVDLFREHLVVRGRGEDPYQLQRLATCAAAAGTAAFWIAATARRVTEAAEAPADLVGLTNLTRMITERAALDVLEAVHRGVGLGGFLRPSPIERVSRDLSTYLRQPVPDLAMADAGRAVLASSRPTAALWGAA